MLKRRGKYWYGERQADVREMLERYSRKAGYPADHFGDASCSCSGTLFRLELDDNEGAAVRICARCGSRHAIGDSAEYLQDAELQECACPCGHEAFEITAAVSLYEGSEDVRWLYLGCRCPECGLTAVYGDWKNEFIGYQALLAKV